MLAADYPLLNVFLSMLWFFLFIAWVWVFVAVVADLLRSHDMSGGAKALWIALVLALPVLGALLYVVTRGDKMAEHRVRDIQSQDSAVRSYIQSVAGAKPSRADELGKLAVLHDNGVLDEAEYTAERA